jgi:neurotransmitter:Na+ symporter, NSS family
MTKRLHYIKTVREHAAQLKPRPHWKSHMGFMFAAIGSAVGLGNIWRFSYVAGENGGGAFLIPYLICILLLGIPLIMMDFAAGRHFKTSVIPTIKKICAKAKGIGYLVVAGSFLIMSYYAVIVGWTLVYAFFFLTNKVMPFDAFTQTNYSLVGFIVVMIFTLWIVTRGVQAGIEKTCKVLIPILCLFLIILLARALTLPNASAGIKYFLSPNLSVMTNAKVWLAAVGQAFFSLSVGYGVYLTYASYEDSKDNVPLSSITIAIADTLIAVVSGLMIFSFVFSHGMDPASGPQLAFVILPKIFSEMLFGTFFATLFFLLLFVAGISSMISLMEVVVAALIDEFKLNRKKAAWAGSIGVFLVGLPSALSYSGYDWRIQGKLFLDFADMAVGNYFVPFAAALLCLVLAWKWNPKEYLSEINEQTPIKVPQCFVTLVQYVIPVALLLFIIGTALGV